MEECELPFIKIPNYCIDTLLIGCYFSTGFLFHKKNKESKKRRYGKFDIKRYFQKWEPLEVNEKRFLGIPSSY